MFLLLDLVVVMWFEGESVIVESVVKNNEADRGASGSAVADRTIQS